MFSWKGSHNNGCPCYECVERRIGCHGECAQYGEWRKAMDEKREAELSSRVANGTISETAMRQIWRKQRYINQQPFRRSGNKDR